MGNFPSVDKGGKFMTDPDFKPVFSEQARSDMECQSKPTLDRPVNGYLLLWIGDRLHERFVVLSAKSLTVDCYIYRPTKLDSHSLIPNEVIRLHECGLHSSPNDMVFFLRYRDSSMEDVIFAAPNRVQCYLWKDAICLQFTRYDGFGNDEDRTRAQRVAAEKARRLAEQITKVAKIPRKYHCYFTFNNQKILMAIQATTGATITESAGLVDPSYSFFDISGSPGDVDRAVGYVKHELLTINLVLSLFVAPRMPPANSDVVMGEEKDCLICRDAKPTTAFIPCGHRNFCTACAETAFQERKVCPCCRGTSSALLRVYV